ncbi:aminopeptidase [Candidatus Nanohalobium constans]|uniref:Leucyl aminopeptidase (Aminopeptidase T) n=1 Tax=Candidatus Nanohalobium constans TaxID=2565781 RepID=A0A5Q0UFQ7_9ARCH|nr:aminopeptidase [Candidatus Nanohalobium constans]QGA80374.1 leucyl aminopeptidase (aminopeptidase T) [Candidatus Nanohalobium constans]
MSLREGASTIIDQCLEVQQNEKVLVLNDSNDRELIESLVKVLEDRDVEHGVINYEEPENQGDEPPEYVADAMKQFDVVIAPTMKSLSHTNASGEAAEQGARVATLPTVNKRMWKNALQADYEEVERITDKAAEQLQGVEKIRIETEKGTDLELEIDSDYLEPSNGKLTEAGIGNIPSGEVFTGPLDANGTLVLEENSFGSKEDEGNEIVIENRRVTEIRNAPEDSKIVEKIENIENADQIAEFGFGTNPEAEYIGHTLQDEKILGTVHIALGENSFCLPEGHEKANESSLHWDFILQNPTVWFDDEKVLDEGEPVFLD